MAKPTHYSTKEAALGLALVLTLVTLTCVGLKYAQIGRFWKKRQEIFVVFDHVGSLTVNAPVRYNGLEIGRVKSLRPVHLDEKIIEDRFRALTRRDIDNLPFRSDTVKRSLLELPPESLDKAFRAKLDGTTMIELCLEVLAENDPIRYRLDDEIRIVTTVFGDSVVEIVSGSGPVNASAKPQYVLGNSGDFFSNLAKSMVEVKEILDGVADVIGTEERKSFASAQNRYAPANSKIDTMTKTSTERMKRTLKLFSTVTENAKARLDQTGKVLQSLQPAAEKATNSIQSALKDIQAKTQDAQGEAADAMMDISRDVLSARDNVKEPLVQVREMIDDVKGDLASARANVEKIPARLDSADDVLGSMVSQSEADLERFGIANKKSMLNLKITAFMAKEHKDLMIANRDVGENTTQNAIDIQRRLGMISRRVRDAGAETVEAARDLEADLLAGPVIARAESVSKKLEELRVPIDEARDPADEAFIRPWQERKRAAWYGDGLVRW